MKNFIYDDEMILDENSQQIVINNPGTVIIQPPAPSNNFTPQIQVQPYNDELQTSIDPPVPDAQMGIPADPNSAPVPYSDEVEGEIPATNPNEIPQSFDDVDQPPVNGPLVPDDLSYSSNGLAPPIYNDEPMELPGNELPAQDQIPQEEMPPVDPNSGVPMAEPFYDDEVPVEPQMAQLGPDGNILNPTTGMPINSEMPPEAIPQPYNDEVPVEEIDPNTGQPMQPMMDPSQQIDPNTGMPMAPAPQVDPATGMPMDPNAQQIDPMTGQPMAPQIDPMTGMPIDPNAQQIDPMTGMPIDPMGGMGGPDAYSDEGKPELRIGNSSEVTTGRPIPLEDLAKITELKHINTQLMKVRSILEKELNASYNKVEDKLNEAIEYFRAIISNLDSYVGQIDDIIIKYKRFIVTILTQISILKKQEMDEKK